MGRNLGPLNIKDSYEGLVQISGSSRDTLTDGSGSVITNLDVTSSFALTASFAENALTPNLQSVTTEGNTTTAGIFVEDTSGTGDDSLIVKGNFGNAFGKLYQSSGATVIEASGSGANDVIVAVNGTTVVDIDETLINFEADVDASGHHIQAAAFTGSLKGNVDGVASDSDKSNIYGDATDAERPLIFVNDNPSSGASQAEQLRGDTTKSITYNPVTNTLTVPNTTTTASYATTASFAENVSTPTLQEVTDAGSTTTNNLNTGTIDAGALRSRDGFTVTGSANQIRIVDNGDLTKNINVSWEENNNTLEFDSSGTISGATFIIDETTFTKTQLSNISASGYVSATALTASGLIYPTADGTVGQVVTTDGAGNLTLEDAGGGGKFNDGAGLESIVGQMASSGSNSSPQGFLFGSGSSITTTGKSATILGSYNSTLGGSGFGSAIIGGTDCTISSNFGGGIITSQTCTNNGYFNLLGGSIRSTISGDSFNFIIGGDTNTASGNHSGILGGQSNTVTGGNNVIIGGQSGTASGVRVNIIGGLSNYVNNGSQTLIGGGQNNRVNGGNDNGLFILGSTNTLVQINGGSNAGVLGGLNNDIRNFDGTNANVASGFSREVHGGIVFGRDNYIGKAGNQDGRNGLPLILGGYSNDIGATTINGGTFTAYSTIINSSGSSIDSGSFQGIIGGYENYVSGSDNAYIIASNNSTIDSHNNSVIIGGSGLTTTKDDEVVVPNLTISGSGAVLTFADGTTQTTAGGDAFPYTGSAEITGSLEVEGDSKIGGANNTISSTGEYNVILNDSGSITGTTSYSFIAGGGFEGESTISGGLRNAIIATRNNTITGGAETSAIIAGLGNTINASSGVRQAGIFASRNSSITGGSFYGQAIIGARNGSLTGAQGVIVGGENSVVSHSNSVVVGGTSLATTKANEVVVPNLTISGSGAILTFADGTTQSSAASGGPIVDGDGTNSARSSQHSASTAPNTNDLNIGGSNNTIANTNVGNYTIVGGTGNNIASPSYGNASIFGSKNGTITRGSDGTAMLGGINNSLTDTNNWSSVMLGGSGNTLNGGGKRRFMLGGEDNTMGGGNDSFSGIIGGENNTLTGHERSVIIGGDTLSTTKSDEVVVPNLTTNGAVVQNVEALTIATNVAEIDASLGNLFTLTLQNGVNTELQLTNQSAGQTFQVQITNNATGAGTISFDSQFEFEGGTAFTATATTSAVDILTFTCFGGGNVQCVSAKNFS